MKKTSKSFRQVMLVGGAIASLLVFSTYRMEKSRRKRIKIKNWLKWEVEFNENATSDEKGKALAAIDKYIQDSVNEKLVSLKFNHRPVPHNRNLIMISVTPGRGSQQHIGGYQAPAPPPHHIFMTITTLSPIKDITDIGMGLHA